MEGKISNVLDNYLAHKIVQKIEIKNVIAHDFIDGDFNIIYKAYSIPELLKLFFDIMRRSISSTTCTKILRDIFNLF